MITSSKYINYINTLITCLKFCFHFHPFYFFQLFLQPFDLFLLSFVRFCLFLDRVAKIGYCSVALNKKAIRKPDMTMILSCAVKICVSHYSKSCNSIMLCCSVGKEAWLDWLFFLLAVHTSSTIFKMNR